jgi:hypothetical protein
MIDEEEEKKGKDERKDGEQRGKGKDESLG